jgi:hypothetical protein
MWRRTSCFAPGTLLSCRKSAPALRVARARLICAAALVVTSSLASVTEAQDAPAAPRRPYKGLFAAQTNPNHQFDVQWSTLGVYDDNASADTANYNPLYQTSGSYALLAGGLTFTTKTHRGSIFTVNVRSTTRYSAELRQLNVIDAAGTIGYSTTLHRGFTIALSQSVSYQPFFQLDFMGAALPVIGQSADGVQPSPTTPESHDVPLTSVDTYQYEGGAHVSQTLGMRSMIAGEFTYRLTKFGNSSQPFLWRQVGGHYSYNLDRYAKLRLGYSYGLQQDSRRVDVPATVNQNVEVGVDYGRPISQSRRTHVNFSSGSSVVTYLGQQYFVLTGEAGVRREIGQTWNASATFHRGVQFVEGLNGPMKADSIQGQFAGLVSHRFNVSLSGGYSKGQIGLGSTDPGYATYLAGASLRYAFTRSLSLQADYQHYMYDFAEGVRPPIGVPSALNRNSVRVGLSGWLPLQGR